MRVRLPPGAPLLWFPAMPEHGTISGYVTWGCRDDCCREAWAEYQADYKEKRRTVYVIVRGGKPEHVATTKRKLERWLAERTDRAALDVVPLRLDATG